MSKSVSLGACIWNFAHHLVGILPNIGWNWLDFFACSFSSPNNCRNNIHSFPLIKIHLSSFFDYWLLIIYFYLLLLVVSARIAEHTSYAQQQQQGEDAVTEAAGTLSVSHTVADALTNTRWPGRSQILRRYPPTTTSSSNGDSSSSSSSSTPGLTYYIDGAHTGRSMLVSWYRNFVFILNLSYSYNKGLGWTIVSFKPSPRFSSAVNILYTKTLPEENANKERKHLIFIFVFDQLEYFLMLFRPAVNGLKVQQMKKQVL